MVSHGRSFKNHTSCLVRKQVRKSSQNDTKKEAKWSPKTMQKSGPENAWFLDRFGRPKCSKMEPKIGSRWLLGRPKWMKNYILGHFVPTTAMWIGAQLNPNRYRNDPLKPIWFPRRPKWIKNDMFLRLVSIWSPKRWKMEAKWSWTDAKSISQLPTWGDLVPEATKLDQKSYQNDLTLNHQSTIINHRSSIMNHRSWMNHQLSIIDHQSSIINQSSIVNHQSPIVDQSSIINQSSIFNHVSWIGNHEL